MDRILLVIPGISDIICILSKLMNFGWQKCMKTKEIYMAVQNIDMVVTKYIHNER